MHGYNDYPPHLFYKGTVKISVILEQAQRDTNGINKLNKGHELFGTPAVGRVARIRRYINGEALKMPEAINNEKYESGVKESMKDILKRPLNKREQMDGLTLILPENTSINTKMGADSFLCCRLLLMKEKWHFA